MLCENRISCVLVGLLASGALCACKSAPRDSAPPTPSALASLGLPIAAPSASASSPPPLEVHCANVNAVEAARRLLNAWNQALDSHDADALRRLYAPKVAFYGRELGREQVIAAKRAALAASPGFRQQLSDVQIESAPGGGATAAFSKHSGSGAQLSVVAAHLAVEARGEVYAITVETDDPTDARASAKQSCVGIALQVASALPDVTKEWKEAGPNARTGGLVYSEDGANVSASLGFNHDDRFENVFGVEVKNGDLVVAHYDSPLAVPAAQLARVKSVCLRAAKAGN